MIFYTINTDASFNPKLKRGSWAYWIKGDGNFHVKKAGVFRDELEGAHMAELLAFEKAMQVINSRTPRYQRGAVGVYVNTDCMYVIKVINGEIQTPRNRHKKFLLQAIRVAIDGYNFIPRHVKAHTGDLTEKRSWVNDWCDTQAKKVLREEGLL